MKVNPTAERLRCDKCLGCQGAKMHRAVAQCRLSKGRLSWRWTSDIFWRQCSTIDDTCLCFSVPSPSSSAFPFDPRACFRFWFGSHLIGAACAVAGHSLRPPRPQGHKATRLECIWCLDQSFGMRCACALHMQHICFVHSMYIYSYIHICLIYVCVTSMCNETLSSVAASGTTDGMLGSGRRRHRTRAPLRGSPPNGKGSHGPQQCRSETRRYTYFK